MEIYSQVDHDPLAALGIVIFSNVHIFTLDRVEELSGNTGIYGIKPIKSENDRYICIESPLDGKFRVSIRAHGPQLKEGITTVDFLETFGKHSVSKYTFADTFTKNLQLNLRIFATKNNQKLPF